MDCEADNSTKAVWFKVTHKSLVWYRRGVMPAPPADWEAWVGLCRERAKEHPPLAIGAADGWVLTDWFENVLLGIDPGLYGKLHLNPPGGWSHASVRETLLRLATLWSIPGLVPGGGRQALTTQFQDSILDVFRYGRADMLAAPDFAWPVIDRYGSGPEALSFRFPGLPAAPNAARAGRRGRRGGAGVGRRSRHGVREVAHRQGAGEGAVEGLERRRGVSCRSTRTSSTRTAGDGRPGERTAR